jgi:hypothetical protein
MVDAVIGRLVVGPDGDAIEGRRVGANHVIETVGGQFTGRRRLGRFGQIDDSAELR